MVSDLYGFIPALASLIVNLIIMWATLLGADTIVKYIGENGARGISKVISLLLAAIAVMMIKRGIEAFLG